MGDILILIQAERSNKCIRLRLYTVKSQKSTSQQIKGIKLMILIEK